MPKMWVLQASVYIFLLLGNSFVVSVTYQHTWVFQASVYIFLLLSNSFVVSNTKFCCEINEMRVLKNSHHFKEITVQDEMLLIDCIWSHMLLAGINFTSALRVRSGETLSNQWGHDWRLAQHLVSTFFFSSFFSFLFFFSSWPNIISNNSLPDLNLIFLYSYQVQHNQCDLFGHFRNSQHRCEVAQLRASLQLLLRPAHHARGQGGVQEEDGGWRGEGGGRWRGRFWDFVWGGKIENVFRLRRKSRN